ncbi:hypothetical protein MJH12_04190, partial [bacterium]|nr:hypothetical protein [bacterium]
EEKLIDQDSYSHLIIEEIRAKRRSRINQLPHYSNYLKNQNIVYSKINMSLQNQAQYELKQIVSKYKGQGVLNGACIIYDFVNKEVITWLGSQDFHDSSILGQNDGILAKRSPGSTLKPLIYAKAMDESLISPKQLLLDIPMSYGDYSPQNFDGKYYGLITAEEALNLSLNIPAIDLNIHLNENLYQILQAILPKPFKHSEVYYGQSIVLGGLSLSLYDLVKIYGVLANEGKNLDSNQSIISPQSAYLVSKIMRDNFRSNLAAYWDSQENSSPYAFKTGTSAGRRDLWTIAFNGRFIVAVWFGDFKGKPTKETSGLSVSWVMAHSLMKQIGQIYGEYSQKTVDDILIDKTCQDSIFRVQKDCQQVVSDLLIKNQQVKGQCRLLNDEKFQYLQKHHLLKSLQDSGCLSHFKNRAPKILSPLNRSKIVQSKNIPIKFQKTRFKCISSNPSKKIYWFLNSTLIKEMNSGNDFY